MNIMILGSSGALGFKLWHGLSVDGTVTGTSGIDITSHKEVEETLDICNEQGHPVDMIINCAAYTNVSGAETLEGSKKAWEVNAQAVAMLAGICLDQRIQLVHISTDYVFDGDACDEYTEDDPVNPIQNYGRTKLAGELAIQTIMNPGTWTIVRTSTLYGPPRRPSFVRTIVETAVTHNRVVVVDDQASCPTSVDLLAELIEHLVIDNKIKGIVHATGEDYCNKYSLACEIVRLLELKCSMYPKGQDPAERPERPSFSALGSMFRSPKIMHWNDDLSRHFKTYSNEWREYIEQCKSEQP